MTKHIHRIQKIKDSYTVVSYLQHDVIVVSLKNYQNETLFYRTFKLEGERMEAAQGFEDTVLLAQLLYTLKVRPRL